VYTACQSDQFECTNGTCISMNQRCDGVAHCPSGEDELYCIKAGEQCST